MFYPGIKTAELGKTSSASSSRREKERNRGKEKSKRKEKKRKKKKEREKRGKELLLLKRIEMISAKLCNKLLLYLKDNFL